MSAASLISIQIEVGRVPDGEKVKKIRGEKEYAVRSEVKIHQQKGRFDPDVPHEIKGEGCVFLVSDNGYISCIPETTVVVWRASLQTIARIYDCWVDEIDDK